MPDSPEHSDVDAGSAVDTPDGECAAGPVGEDDGVDTPAGAAVDRAPLDVDALAGLFESRPFAEPEGRGEAVAPEEYAPVDRAPLDADAFAGLFESRPFAEPEGRDEAVAVHEEDAHGEV